MAALLPGGPPGSRHMASTTGGRWKGGQLCKPHKNARPGDAYRMPISAARRGYGGRLRRINRHDIDRDS